MIFFQYTVIVLIKIFILIITLVPIHEAKQLPASIHRDASFEEATSPKGKLVNQVSPLRLTANNYGLTHRLWAIERY